MKNVTKQRFHLALEASQVLFTKFKALPKRLILLCLLFSGIQLITSCEDDMPDYDSTREYQLQNFSSINLGDALQVEIREAEEFKVLSKGEQKDVDDLELRVEDGVLTGNYRPGSRSHKRTLVQIYLPKLEEVNVHGATNTTIHKFSGENDSLKLTVSGAAEATTHNDFRLLILEVSGASKAILWGNGNTVRAKVSGASELKAEGYSAENYQVEVNGASKATVYVSHKLNAIVNGSSTLYYTGNPDLVEKEVTSDSRISSF